MYVYNLTYDMGPQGPIYSVLDRDLDQSVVYTSRCPWECMKWVSDSGYALTIGSATLWLIAKLATDSID